MAKIKKFIKVTGQDIEISHDDQEKDGLKFRVQFKHNTGTIMLISGEEDRITEYMTRYTNCTTVPDADVKALYDETFPNKQPTCEECGGTGKKTIKEFNLVDTKNKLKA